MDEGLPDGTPLLVTKTHVPGPAGAQVERTRLLRAVREVLQPGLSVLLVSAPAGFGKSTLVSSWITAERPARVSWLTLDADDNDPVRFWSYFVFAVRQACPGFAEGALRVLRSVQMPPLTGEHPVRPALAVLLNELSGLAGQTVVVLDDYHLVTSPAVHADMGYALEHWPANARLVLCTRVDPPLPMHRLRAAGRLLEIRASDLRFSPEETAEFLRAAVQQPLGIPQVRLVDERAEGWIAGLKMTALALRGAPDAPAVIANLSRSSHLVLDYLAQEVLERQEARIQEFLVRTAVLERFCAPLCDAVMERGDSAGALQEIARRNLFLVPLDEQGTWFRYHPLLSDLLRARLTRDHPELPHQLHRRASRWFEASSLPDEAIQHALAVGDVPRVVELVVRHSRGLIWSGRSATVLRWLESVPEEAVTSDLRLVVSRCWVSCFTDRWSLLGADLDRVEVLLTAPAPWGGASVPDDLGKLIRESCVMTVAILRAFLAYRRGDLESAEHLAGRAVGLARGAAPDLLGAALTIHGYVLKDVGRLREAEEALRQSAPLFFAQGNVTAWAVSIFEEVDILLSRGQLGEASRVCESALKALGEQDGLDLPGASLLLVAAAESAWRQAEWRRAQELWQAAAAGAQQAADPVVAAHCALGEVRMAAARGESEEALELLESVEPAAMAQRSQSLRHEAAVLRTVLQGRTGRSAELRRVEESTRQIAAGSGSLTAGVVRARALIELRQPSAAQRLVEGLLEQSRSSGRAGLVLSLMILRARAQWQQGQKEAGLATLRAALELAAPERALRAFLDEGDGLREPMEELLLRCGNAAAAPGSRAAAVRELLGRWRSAVEPVLFRAPREAGTSHRRAGTGFRQEADSHAAPGPGAEEPSAEQLTARELEVLVMVAAGLSNQQIADRLFVSLATVKKHVSATLAKLGAGSRTQAAALARVRGLL